MANTIAAAATMTAPKAPLKISLTQLPNPAPEGSPHPALARSHHTLTVLAHNKAFLFGGLDKQGKLCPPGIHTLTLPTSKFTKFTTTTTTTTPPTATPPDDHNDDDNDISTAYTFYPPYTLQDPSTGDLLVPAPRAEHAACSRGGGRYLLVHGGRDDAGWPVGAGDGDEGNCLWQWDCEELSWGKLRGDTQLGATMAPRFGHWMFCEEEGRGQGEGFLVVVGGKGVEREVWMYDFHGMVWTAMPSVPGAPLAAAYVAGRVYVVARDGEGGMGGMGGVVHWLDLRESAEERSKQGALVWRSVRFPANPPGPVPTPRAGGALVPLATGHGREYLVYMLGGSEGGDAEKKCYSDIWTLQLPAQRHSAAAAADKIKETLPGMDSRELQWAEVEIVPTEQMAEEGKVHPGPRCLFGADSCLDGQGVVLWGGVNGKGESEEDGWLLRLAWGYADYDRRE
ncbi:hypothetical protein N658DRAFT_459059 [Parathielavia hyrcaniae]|uniref:Galactose oxidase n=1 Tax=Parathielavia hyrcaniae TaxID=113614 RepID=A0AAN6SWS8_9PEZI|nr:hypothetical protein N658DRAFT_459059 [Parathielavia hyrcaniae]